MTRNFYLLGVESLGISSRAVIVTIEELFVGPLTTRILLKDTPVSIPVTLLDGMLTYDLTCNGLDSVKLHGKDGVGANALLLKRLIELNIESFTMNVPTTKSPMLLLSARNKYGDATLLIVMDNGSVRQFSPSGDIHNPTFLPDNIKRQALGLIS